MASSLITLRNEINFKLQERTKWLEILKTEKSALKDAAVEVACYQKAQEILQHVAKDVQQEAHKRISSVVTKCLKMVFGEDGYVFEIKFEQKRGKTDAILQFRRDKHEIDPITEAGGGPVEVASFALRVASLALQLPAKRRVLLLDEPFSGLHKSLHERVINMIQVMADELNFQFVLITHESGLTAGKVISLE